MGHWNPYGSFSGTILGIAGDDFAILASDTRLAEGFQIKARNVSRHHPFTEKSVVGAVGFEGDVLTLMKYIEARVKMYKYEHREEISTSALASMISKMLYYRRFFPYYVYNMVVGLDEEGKGAVYSYDPVGSYEREGYRCEGDSADILQPFLDAEIGNKHKSPKIPRPPLTKERAVELAVDAFISAAERNIQTGDGVRVLVITAEGQKETKYTLRRD